MKLLDALFSVCTIFTLMRTSISATKNKEDTFDNAELGEMYETICRDIDIGGFKTFNRPKNMELSYIEDHGFIGPANCIPFDESQISDQCKDDIKALADHREKYHDYLKGLKQTIKAGTQYMASQIGYKNGVLEATVGQALADKIFLRNSYFINYFYARFGNYGQCKQLTSRVFFDYVAKLTKETGQLPKMQAISIMNDTQTSVKVFKKRTSRVYDHVFFVIGGEFPEGTSQVNIDRTKPIPKKYLKGWVCDLWNKDLVFGPLAEIASNNEIYDLSKWKTVTVRDISEPYFLGTEKNYESIPNKLFKKYDYFLNPDLFLDLMKIDSDLAYNKSDEDIKRMIELPLRAAAQADEDEEPDHPEL